MHRRHACLALASGGLLGAGRAPAAGAVTGGLDAAFDSLAARYFDDRMALDPLSASAILAHPRYEGRLAITIAPQEIARARGLNQRVLRALRGMPAIRLSPDRRLSHELLEHELRTALEGDTFPGHLMPMDQFGGLPLQLASLAGGDQAQPLKTAEDLRNYLRRLARLPDFVAQAIANMREGVRRGVTVPRPLVEATLPTLASLADADFGQSAFAEALQHLPESTPTGVRAALQRDYRDTFQRRWHPAARELQAYMRGPYREAARTTHGQGALPNGAAWYAYLVRLHTTTDLSPQAIHAMGLEEVARIHGEIAGLQPHFGVSGSVTDFLRWQAHDTRFRPYSDWAQVLAAYTEVDRRVAPRLARLFGRRPAQALQVREMPALQRDAASPYYNPASPDGSRPGTVFIGAPGGPQNLNSAILTALMLHEGQPGHHFQAALQQALPLPAFRRHGWSTAYGEGWALYAEWLGHELGMYDDPTQHLGYLKLELLRAVRLVADTGLHAMGWTRERTMRYMMDTEGSTERDAKQATERYMAVPGQALAYKIGAMSLQRMRRDSAAALGPRFDVSAFHDLVLGHGTLPLSVLERLVRAWVAGGGRAPT